MGSKYTIKRWFLYQIILKTTIWYHIPSTLYSSIFTTYPYISCPYFSPQSTFFNDAHLYIIFVCANCATFSPQPTIFDSAHKTYFLYAWDVLTPQPTFYSGIFIAHLCMIFSAQKCARYGHFTSLSPSPTLSYTITKKKKKSFLQCKSHWGSWSSWRTS